MRTLCFRMVCGAGGDMILASLIDAGVDIAYLERELGRLDIEGLWIAAERTRRGGIGCVQMNLGWAKQTRYRHVPELLELIDGRGYPARVFRRCERVLRRLAEAEASVHGIAVEKVHFHEIGAVDTIIDVLGACLCLEYLGIERVVFPTLTVGHGTITCEHGVMPVPAPATAHLLRGLRVTTIDVPTEILTPTGCAILTTLGEQSLEGTAGTLAGVGYGCGTKQFEGYPNVLRAELIDTESVNAPTADTVVVLESDMDHLSGEVMAFTAEELFACGALDVSWCPLVMKKGRPGYRLTVLVEPGMEHETAKMIMRQTRTLGVRSATVRRLIARRSVRTSEGAGAELREKVCDTGEATFVKPEYEDLAALARRRGVPLIELLSEYGRQA